MPTFTYSGTFYASCSIEAPNEEAADKLIQQTRVTDWDFETNFTTDLGDVSLCDTEDDEEEEGWTNILSSAPYGGDVYRYASEDAAYAGYIRLIVSATAYWCVDGVTRTIDSNVAWLSKQQINGAIAARHLAWTLEFKDRLYACSDAAVIRWWGWQSAEI